MLKYKFSFVAIGIIGMASLFLSMTTHDEAVAAEQQQSTETACQDILPDDSRVTGPADPLNPMKCQYNDPFTGREVWRMTVDGANGCKNFMGDHSGEASAWSPDGQHITYHKSSCSNKPSGIYIMNVTTGVETFLVGISDTNPYGQPIFTHDGARILYIQETNNNIEYQVRSIAIDSSETNPTTVLSFTDLSFRDLNDVLLITRNVDGSYYAVHPRDGEDSIPVIFSIGANGIGAVLNGWKWTDDSISLVKDGDSSIWHPTIPNQIWATRKVAQTDVTGVWDILSPNDGPIYEFDLFPSHASWHPNGNFFASDYDYLWERSTTGDPTELVQYNKLEGRFVNNDVAHDNSSPHLDFKPDDTDAEWNARLLFDTDRTSPMNARGPFLYVMPMNVLKHTRAPKDNTTSSATIPYIFATHAGDIGSDNLEHIHPHFSPQGDHILWQSDSRTLSYSPHPAGGEFPCGFEIGSGSQPPWGPVKMVDGGTDIYIAPFDNAHFEPGTDKIEIEAECGQLTNSTIVPNPGSGHSVKLDGDSDLVQIQFVARYDAAYKITIDGLDGDSDLQSILVDLYNTDEYDDPDVLTNSSEPFLLDAKVHNLSFKRNTNSNVVQLDKIKIEMILDNASCGGLAQEAEVGTLSGGFVVGNDDNASGGQYVHVPNELGDEYDGPNPQRKAEYCFNVENAGNYVIKANVYGADNSDNSFYVRVDNAPAVGYKWHSLVNTSYAVDYVSAAGIADPVVVSLPAGDHTVSVYLREAGTRLDTIALEPYGDSTSTPTPVPPTSTPLPPTPTPTQVPPTATPVPPTPTPSSGDCGPLRQEAEAGVLSDAFVEVTDEDASGGRYIHVPEVFGDVGNGPNGAYRVTYTFNVVEAGDYQIKAGVQGLDNGSDSFYARVDGAPTAGYKWNIPIDGGFTEVYIRDANNGSALVVVPLEAGEHTVTVYLREDGTRLDWIALESASVSAASLSSSNDAGIDGHESSLYLPLLIR